LRPSRKSTKQERSARTRQSELARSIKLQAKLSALEAARLEVEAYENTIELLLSVHKEQTAAVDWSEYASALPPHPPLRLARHELRALIHGGPLDPARAQDAHDYHQALAAHTAELTELERLQSLARRILTGDTSAYLEAISEVSPVAELSALGSSVRFKTRGPKLIACEVSVRGIGAIPTEMKTLTAAGKVSLKAMPKARFHEVYQDYVCGCVLRLAREMFGLLPVSMVLVTAMVEATDTVTGAPGGIPVLSVAIPRDTLARMDLEHVDPSDAMELFVRRGDAKASRRSGDFVAITPLVPTDLDPALDQPHDLAALVAQVQQARAAMREAATQEA
jgi:hypothetical protein